MPITIDEYNREDLFIDIIGYYHLNGEFPDYKQLQFYGYYKADIMDFCLGMSVPVPASDFKNIEGEPISPNNLDCLCGREFVYCDEIYRFHEGDKSKIDRDYILMCGKCVEKTRMVEGL